MVGKSVFGPAWTTEDMRKILKWDEDGSTTEEAGSPAEENDL